MTAYTNSLDYNRIENSYFSVVKDPIGQELVHDDADFALKDRSHKPTFMISRSQARDKVYYPRTVGVPDGPHDNRFDRADTFDKSFKLTMNPRHKSIPNFHKQMKRDENSVLKGGQMVDIRDRNEAVYEKADPLLQCRKESIIVQMKNMIPRDGGLRNMY